MFSSSTQLFKSQVWPWRALACALDIRIATGVPKTDFGREGPAPTRSLPQGCFRKELRCAAGHLPGRAERQPLLGKAAATMSFFQNPNSAQPGPMDALPCRGAAAPDSITSLKRRSISSTCPSGSFPYSLLMADPEEP